MQIGSSQVKALAARSNAVGCMEDEGDAASPSNISPSSCELEAGWAGILIRLHA